MFQSGAAIYSPRVLRRKPAFCLLKNEMKSSRVPLYLETHPDSHYMPVGSVDGVWVGESRHSASRQLVMVKELRKISISDFDYLVKASHVGIAQAIALYHWHGTLYWAHEWVDLDLFEILPLRDDEMCNIMKQVNVPSHQK